MRVALLLDQCLAPAPGGTGRYAWELARALAAEATTADEVTGWVAWRREMDAARVPGVRGPRRLALPSRVLAEAWSYGRGPTPVKADLVHAPTMLVPPARQPLVVTIHDAVPWTHPETLTPRGAIWHRRMGERAASQAAAIVVPTHAVARELTSVLDLRGRLLVVGEGVAPSLAVPPDVEQRAERLRLPERFVVTVATAEPRKGLPTLLAAMHHPDGPGVPLVHVGSDGWGGVARLLKEQATNSPAGLVRLLGRLPDADLAAVLSRATALAMPSVSEGFGLPLVEAQAVGTAVVCSDAPALVEVANGSARVVPRGDAVAWAEALHEVVWSENERQHLVSLGRENVRRYSWSAAAEQLWNLYRSLA
jgi:glycosyltransferase involved in cell wall biosynthesis